MPIRLLDFLMDACVLLLTQLALGRLNFRRLLRAMLLLALGGMVCSALSLGPETIYLPLCLLTSWVLLGARRWMALLEGAACIYCGYAALAGFLMAGLGRTAALLLPAGILALCLLLRRRRSIRSSWNIEIELRKNGLHTRFPALVDTGNRLREHRSGLPVLIVQERRIQEIAASISSAELRSLPYGVLGSEGELHCFRPDKLYIIEGEKLIPAPDCWIAPFPEKMPGMVRALAPPEFADAAAVSRFTHVPVQNTLRRILSWDFQA